MFSAAFVFFCVFEFEDERQLRSFGYDDEDYD